MLTDVATTCSIGNPYFGNDLEFFQTYLLCCFILAQNHAFVFYKLLRISLPYSIFYYQKLFVFDSVHLMCICCYASAINLWFSSRRNNLHNGIRVLLFCFGNYIIFIFCFTWLRSTLKQHCSFEFCFQYLFVRVVLQFGSYKNSDIDILVANK